MFSSQKLPKLEILTLFSIENAEKYISSYNNANNAHFVIIYSDFWNNWFFLALNTFFW